MGNNNRIDSSIPPEWTLEPLPRAPNLQGAEPWEIQKEIRQHNQGDNVVNQVGVLLKIGLPHWFNDHYHSLSRF